MASAAAETRRIVLLFDERPDLPGLSAIEESIVGTLTSNFSGTLEVYHEAMDLSRFGSNAHRIRLRDFLQAKYEDKKIDVVISIMGPALDFLLSHGDTIFHGVPIVFCGVDKREIGDRSLPPGVSGVFIRRQFRPTLELALSLHPDTQRIVVVAGTSEFDTRVLTEAKKEFREYEGRLAFVYLTELPLSQLFTEVSKLPARTIVLFTTLFQDGAGEPFVPYDVVERLSAAANAPLYGFLDQFLGRGIVGGSLYGLDRQGTEAANLTLDILKGTKASRGRLLEPEMSQLLFDWRQLRRWGISEKKLPAGSQIRFRPSTVWEQHRAFVVAVGAAFASMIAILGALLLQTTRRKRAEASLRQSEERLTFSAASTNTGLWQYDVPSGHIWATEQSRAMFGLHPNAELKSEAFLRAVHPEDRPAVAAGIRSVRNSATAATNTEFRVLQPNGQTRWILATSKMHFDDEGKPNSISGVFRDVTARKTAEHEAEQLSERIATIQDEERQQIALELHDSTAQHLVAAGLNMMTVQSHLPADATIHELCNEVERSLDDATKELRTYSYLLIPPQLAKDGLEAAMRSYVDGFARRTTLETELRISPQAEELPLPSQRALLRVVQEALANVRRHASASRVAITIKCVSDRVHLLVSDNGKGIKGTSNGQLCETLRSGVGIPGMTARLRRLGGDLRIKSGTDGTTLHGVILAREKPQPRWARPARI